MVNVSTKNMPDDENTAKGMRFGLLARTAKGKRVQRNPGNSGQSPTVVNREGLGHAFKTNLRSLRILGLVSARLPTESPWHGGCQRQASV